MGATRTVLQFRIQLRHIEPPIWRRIVVPAEYSFWDLHVAIQDAMGWLDCHLHAFRLRHPDGEVTLIGIPDPEPFEGDPLYLEGWQVRVAPFFTDIGDRAEYEYDFGDGWEHDVVLEQVSPRVAKARYPQCLAGERACPPEDCGGPHGYHELLTLPSIQPIPMPRNGGNSLGRISILSRSSRGP